jgi:hypothetical protein
LGSFPGCLSYSLHLLIGFDGVGGDHGGPTPAMKVKMAARIVAARPAKAGRISLPHAENCPFQVGGRGGGKDENAAHKKQKQQKNRKDRRCCLTNAHSSRSALPSCDREGAIRWTAVSAPSSAGHIGRLKPSCHDNILAGC